MKDSMNRRVTIEVSDVLQYTCSVTSSGNCKTFGTIPTSLQAHCEGSDTAAMKGSPIGSWQPGFYLIFFV
jgi:hypothetical protein